MKIVYMGTPDFAVGPLEAIVAAGHQVTLVVTQPDKQKGRGKSVSYTPVKECAIRHNIPVFQPVKIKEQEAVEILRKQEADIFVVAAFGQILSEELLNMPKYGAVNIHASLLPKYRGAAPIQWVILDGEKETGVTIMQMDKGLDTGDMLLKAVVPIEKEETGETLHDKLAMAGSKLIVEALTAIEAGTIEPEKQKDEESCYARMLTKSLGQINWQEDAEKIERLIRGLNSWPSAYTKYGNKTLKLWKGQVLSEQDERVLESIKGQGMEPESIKPGTVCFVSKEEIYVKTGKDFLNIVELQLEGKKRMTAKEFLLGRQIEVGTVFFAN
ncbi:MAG: methionyl-tRNA formyltransferase [Lachnospiraceae bacterium]|nr:methionyl-tRNA formyltransferase [Lachnospiraceae bacterium]